MAISPPAASLMIPVRQNNIGQNTTRTAGQISSAPLKQGGGSNLAIEIDGINLFRMFGWPRFVCWSVGNHV